MIKDIFSFRRVLILLFLVGILSRVLFLGKIPAGMTWDEAAIGYNGWSIINYRRDEWLIKLPISFKSFGDFKAPFAIYLNGVFTKIFGLNITAIRLPFALVGLAGLFIWYLLLQELLNHQNDKNEQYSSRLNWLMVLGLTLYLTSPTLIHFSRVGFESGMSLVFTMSAILFWFYGLKTKRYWAYFWVVLSAMAFGLTVYTYHSAKVTTPLILVYLVVAAMWQKRFDIKKSIALICITLLIALPFIKDSIWGEGLTRANVTVFAHSSSLSQGLKAFIYNIWVHLTPAFLLQGKADTIRHTALTGFLGIIPGALVYLCIFSFIFIKNLRQFLFKDRLFIFGVFLCLIGLTPAFLGIEVPHPNRALLSLPGFYLLIVSLINVISAKYHGHLMAKYLLPFMIVLVFSSNLLAVVNYFGFYNQKSVAEFNQGYVQAFNYARQYEKGVNGMPQVKQIIVDSHYGQPYIFALLANQISPLAYHNGALVKYLFVDKIYVGDMERSDTLLMATNQTELKPENATFRIDGEDGSHRFLFYYLKPKP